MNDLTHFVVTAVIITTAMSVFVVVLYVMIRTGY